MAAGEPEQFATADHPRRPPTPPPARFNDRDEQQLQHGQATAAGESQQRQQQHQLQQEQQQHATTNQPMPAAAAESLTQAGTQMLEQMKVIAESAERAAKAAEEAAETAKQRSEGFKSAAESVNEQQQGNQTLTSELLRQHTKQQSEVRHKSPPLGKAQPEAAKMGDNQKSDQANIGTGTWQLLYPIAAQATSAEFQSYTGLAVGDILELSAGCGLSRICTIICNGINYGTLNQGSLLDGSLNFIEIGCTNTISLIPNS